MSETTSAATGRCFGIQRVCQVWERSRSALYARRARAHHHRLGAGPARRGPPPRQSDAQLLAAIRTDLARSPFHGEGHRKVHARLRILDGIRVARPRVLRVMRAHGLLSPHRGRQGAAKTHDGRVITQAPNVLWGTDGVRVFTLDDGWGWIFAAVEHGNAECMGWHVCKVGSRFAALDPIAQGLERLYGSLDADVARGLALRMDHGSQYLSDHFLKQPTAVGRRHALSRPAPARTPRLCHGQVARLRQWPPAQVLSHYQRGPGPADDAAAAVAGRGRNTPGNLAEGAHSMTPSPDRPPLEEQIAHWRRYLHRRRAINGPDVEELEGHLRDQVVALTDAGLAADEAFLIAVKRMGSLDALSREFAREHSERLWRQLVVAAGDIDDTGTNTWAETLIVLSLALAAALVVKVPALFGLRLDSGFIDEPFYARNASLFVLPLLTVYFVWKRGSGSTSGLWLALPFAAGAVFANVFRFRTGSDTEVLTALHLPIALWLVVSFAYVGGRWFADGGRMDFVRFSGELVIY